MAKIIDIGEKSVSYGQHSIDVSDEDYGYIVSHQNFGNEDYEPNRDWTLSLTDLQSIRVEMNFEEINLEMHCFWIFGCYCYDYLRTPTHSRICGTTTRTIVETQLQSRSIFLNLKTSRAGSREGFWLQYTGEPVLLVLLDTSTFSKHTLY